MALEIDTLTNNKRIFNPDSTLNSTGSYGVWDLTKASMTYNNVSVQIKTFFAVTEYYQMRPDIIAAIKLGDQGMVGSLLKFNSVSNPFAVKEGTVFAIPESSTVQESFRTKQIKDQTAVSSNTNTNPNNVFKKNQEQKRLARVGKNICRTK